MDANIDALVEQVVAGLRREIGAHEPPAGLRELPCHTGPDTCIACGLCAARRPWSVRALVEQGASRVGAGRGTGEVAKDLAGMIDHTLLKADATAEDLRKLCEEARTYGFATVCLNSSNVRRAKTLLAGSAVKVVAVVGFPLGAMAPSAKAFEARDAVRAGADEIDMVINLGALKSRDYETVLCDIEKVVEAACGRPVKVILETGALTDDEKVAGCTLAKLGGAAFVKTSTGFGPGGATTEDIGLMRRVVGEEMGVKASGGVRTREDADKMVRAGADRIGASASVAIVTGTKTAKTGY